MFQITLTDEQAELIIKALDGYAYITSDVLSYDEVQEQKQIKLGILDQFPDRLF